MTTGAVASQADITVLNDVSGSAGTKCVTVIFNPVSGQGDPEARKAAITEALAQQGYRCQNLVTTPENGARFFAKQAINDGVDRLAVSGGDGTVMEAMAALIGTNIPLAVFPAGTGNLLSLNLNLPRALPEAVHTALFGERRALDLARFYTPEKGDDDRYFAIVAGAGYDAHVIHDADREAKNRLGLGAYLFAALRNLKRRPVLARIRLDNGRQLRRRTRSVMVANMGHLQGNVMMVPGAEPDDGLLDVTILKAETMADWARLAFNALRHRLDLDPSVEYHRARLVEVALSHPQPMQFDGEEADKPHQAFSVEVLPGAVQIMVPKTALP